LADLRAGAETTVCVLANNHVTDFGPRGVLSTLRRTANAGLLTVGAGADIQAARRPLRLMIRGRHVSLLAYCETEEYVGGVAATGTTPGVAPLEPDAIAADVRAARAEGDDVWVFLHWGREFLRCPSPQERDWALRFVAAGATLIVGTHSHVPRGWETVDGASIFYGLGNFVFPPLSLIDGVTRSWDWVSQAGMFICGELQGVEWEWRPDVCHVSSSGCPERMTNSARARWLARWQAQSRQFGSRYAAMYPRIQRCETVSYVGRRMLTMTWQERTYFLRRLLRRTRA